MVPLYAARVQDLRPDDVAVFKCGACGHTAELPPSALLRGLQLKPTDKVLDLERRLRCRLCYPKDQAVVSSSGRRRPPGAASRPHNRPRANGAVGAGVSTRSVSMAQLVPDGGVAVILRDGRSIDGALG